jgi:ribosomal protein S18 acetylase RimI-like enzyme
MLLTRLVSVDDLDTICRHREEMFRESNTPGRTAELLGTMTTHFREWLAPRLADGSYFGYLVEEQREVVAGIGLLVIDWPPHPSHRAQDKRGYVLNVLVAPAYRKKGIARNLMELGERELAARGVSFAALHATRMGKPLYESMGWASGSEMTKSLG